MNFYKVTCPGCGDDFISNRSHRKYCGPRCAMRIKRAKNNGQITLAPKKIMVESNRDMVVRYAESDQRRKNEQKF